MTEGLPSGAPVAIKGGEGAVADAVAGVGGDPTAAPADASLLITVGRGAFRSLGEAPPTCPVLPIEAGRGFRSVPRRSVDEAVRELFDDGWSTISHPILAVSTGTTTHQAIADIALVVAEPGRISEFAIRWPPNEMASVRADGVVVASPGGSVGYARAAGGPLVGLESGVVAVVPIGPYVVDPDHWVLRPDGLRLSVEREETPVQLVVDGTVTGPVDPDAAIDVSDLDDLTTVVVGPSRSVATGLETP